ncbi:MAG: hypothetical protein JWQ44_2534 [Chthoniobacter sp.]|nr:hypothetical protein [Chthoniobacter sp.]
MPREAPNKKRRSSGGFLAGFRVSALMEGASTTGSARQTRRWRGELRSHLGRSRRQKRSRPCHFDWTGSRERGSESPTSSSVRLCGGEFGDEGGEEVRGGGAGGGELRFQRVHQGHQLPHFGHDPALFGEGWDGDDCGGELRSVEIGLSALLNDFRLNLGLPEIRRVHCDAVKGRMQNRGWKPNADEIRGERGRVVLTGEDANLAD